MTTKTKKQNKTNKKRQKNKTRKSNKTTRKIKGGISTNEIVIDENDPELTKVKEFCNYVNTNTEYDYNYCKSLVEGIVQDFGKSINQNNQTILAIISGLFSGLIGYDQYMNDEYNKIDVVLNDYSRINNKDKNILFTKLPNKKQTNGLFSLMYLMYFFDNYKKKFQGIKKIIFQNRIQKIKKNLKYITICFQKYINTRNGEMFNFKYPESEANLELVLFHYFNFLLTRFIYADYGEFELNGNKVNFDDYFNKKIEEEKFRVNNTEKVATEPEQPITEEQQQIPATIKPTTTEPPQTTEQLPAVIPTTIKPTTTSTEPTTTEPTTTEPTTTTEPPQTPAVIPQTPTSIEPTEQPAPTSTEPAPTKTTETPPTETPLPQIPTEQPAPTETTGGKSKRKRRRNTKNKSKKRKNKSQK